jgi:hypothetical protein
MKYIFSIIIILISFCAFHLNANTLVGKVVDEKTNLPIEFACVFFANTTFGTYSDKNGEFSLSTSQKGVFDLVVSHVSYQTFNYIINENYDSTYFIIKMDVKTYTINSVIVKIKDPQRETNLEIFENGLLGVSQNAKKCKIFNSSVLHFTWPARILEAHYWLFNAVADSALIINNVNLGYRIIYNLEYFKTVFNSTSKTTFFYGYPFFEDYIDSTVNIKRILKLRKLTYEGSKLHFFRSLYSKTLDEEGFETYRVEEYPKGKNETENYGLLEDTVLIGKINKKLGQTKAPLNLYNYLAIDSISGSAVLNYNEPFEIRYVNRGEELRYIIASDFHKGLKRRLGNQTTIVRIKSGQLHFFSNGSYENTNNLFSIGYWCFKKMANSLPYNYKSY